MTGMAIEVGVIRAVRDISRRLGLVFGAGRLYLGGDKLVCYPEAQFAGVHGVWRA